MLASFCQEWASAEMVSLIREAQVFRPALRAAFVINRRVSTTVIGREARGALADQPLPSLLSEGRYITTVSHELRTPLNSILGYAQLLEEDASVPPHRRQAPSGNVPR